MCGALNSLISNISFLGKLPHTISYFHIPSISFFGNVFILAMVVVIPLNSQLVFVRDWQ